jgi:hypothetical protein
VGGKNVKVTNTICSQKESYSSVQNIITPSKEGKPAAYEINQHIMIEMLLFFGVEKGVGCGVWGMVGLACVGWGWG